MAGSAEGIVKLPQSSNRQTSGKATPAVRDDRRSSPSNHVAHYPLDGVRLPFRRYDHRPLTARDIMVHRIMTDYMNPSRVVACTYDIPITYPSVFDPIKAQDREIGLDLQVLSKMLFTSYSYDPPPLHRSARAQSDLPPNIIMPDSHVFKGHGRQVKYTHVKFGENVVHGENRRVPTLGEQIQDLVTRHYLESDDMAIRTWISRARLPGMPAGPNSQTDNSSRSVTRARMIKRFSRMVEAGALRDGKSWGQEDVAHIQSLKSRVAAQDSVHLYDGGAAAVGLRRNMEYDCTGTAGAYRRLDYGHWTVTTQYQAVQTLPTWPEREPAIRFIPQLSWRDRRISEPLWVGALLDLSLSPGRGRDRDGIWTTGQGSLKLSRKADPDGEFTGCFNRIRKRSSSEPPPGSFTVAHFPTPSQAVGFVRLEMVFPRMTLAQLDRRSRRRSLSRTRVEEMFDWDVNLACGSHDLGTVDGGNSEKRNTASTQPGQDLANAAQRGKENQTVARPGPEQMRCENCYEFSHQTSRCLSPCGHCGAPNPDSRMLSRGLEMSTDVWYRSNSGVTVEVAYDDSNNCLTGQHGSPHLAPGCPVARRNRCKCIPFPTFHVAARCPERCRRACGSDRGPRGSFHHRNAMTCRARCCMCGLRGHCGRDCRLRRCRCGGTHLGQDCGWHPECRVPGCDRFLCGLHCRGCGSTEKPFVGWLCARCLGAAGGRVKTGPVKSSAKVEERLGGGNDEVDEEEIEPHESSGSSIENRKDKAQSA